MVFYFTCNVVSPPRTFYMGFDKHENEELIRWGWPEERCMGESLDDVPEAVIQDCAQLVKANSIQGNKVNDVDVVFTMWANLKKTPGMDVGQVGFFKQKEVRTIRVEKRINEIVNRLNKTKKQKEKEEAEKRAKESELRSYSNLMREENMTSNQEGGDGYESDDFM
ncbi:Coiled-coil domain-containing protein 25 [Lamellibrachia satsuma]|nr:Coiled-coil domain-containing protein 25 [Lamellibrachia satsuma]